MVDALLVLQASTTITSTTSSTGLALPAGTPRRGMEARIIYSAAAVGSGTGTLVYEIDFAPDGSTWQTIGVAATVALSTTNASGEIYIPFSTPLMAVPNTAAAVRLTATLTGTSPTVTHNAYVGNAMP